MKTVGLIIKSDKRVSKEPEKVKSEVGMPNETDKKKKTKKEELKPDGE